MQFTLLSIGPCDQEKFISNGALVSPSEQKMFCQAVED